MAVIQATPAEKIEQLEATKSKLVKQKMELQSKIDRLNAKPTEGNWQRPPSDWVKCSDYEVLFGRFLCLYNR